MFQLAFDSALFTFNANAPAWSALFELPPTIARTEARADAIPPKKFQEPQFTIPE